MKAARLHDYDTDLRIDQVDEPAIAGPHDSHREDRGGRLVPHRHPYP